MKCDHCDNAATVQETIIQGGKIIQRHLCERCAKSFGLKIQGHPKLAQALTQAVVAHAISGGPAAEEIRAAAAAVCGSCGLHYAHFRQAGMLGCPDCYRAFEAQLAPLLQRAHEGATHHVGKVPKRLAAAKASGVPTARERAITLFGTPEERQRRLATLGKQLEEAVAAEQYERAAQLRDELRRISDPDPRMPMPPAVPPAGDSG